jgi:ribosomal peptide maturation radical SAM protein 1
LLKAHMSRQGVPCEVAYLNLAFAELLGREHYERLYASLPPSSLAGEWVFAQCLWGRDTSLPDSYADDVLRGRWRLSEDDVDLVLRARALAPGFLESSLADMPWADYDIVGFSSFAAQNVASLALARRIKQAHPGVTVVFGGANWQGLPGLRLHSRMRFVDFACSGEGDVCFPLLVRHLAGDGSVRPEQIPGLLYRRAGASAANPEAEPLADLDSLPLPDYSDFYAARHRYPAVRAAPPSLVVETSRGCWWAANGPCCFCGLDSRTRTYRAKGAPKVIAELRELTALWPAHYIYLADTVVSPAFLSEVLPALTADPLPARLFFEVRPELTVAQVEMIAAIRAEIQPGIESLSDHVLRLMHKGTRALENVRLLKRCKAMGIKVHWNFLHGLPGETSEDDDAMLRMLPSIRFLAAPRRCLAVSVDRYSPYFEEPERHGIARLSVPAAYRYVYPFSERVLADLAFALEFECAVGCAPPDVTAALEDEVSKWQHESHLGDLRIAGGNPTAMTLVDKRAIAAERQVTLDQLESLLYRACDGIGKLDTLRRLVHETWPTMADVDVAVDSALASLVSRRLMVNVGHRYLSLALPEGVLRD